MTKYLVNQSTIDSIVFKYLDLTLKGLEKRKPKYFKGIVFAYPDEEYGILGWENDGTLYIYYTLINEISETFGLDKSDSQLIVGGWFSDRYQLEVRNTVRRFVEWRIMLEIDTN